MKKTAEAFHQNLVDNGFLQKAQVEEVRHAAQERKEKFKKACVRLGFMTEATYVMAEAEYFELPYVKLEDTKPTPEALKLVPDKLAKEHGVLPLAVQDQTLTVAVADPYNVFMVDAVKKASKKIVKLSLTTETELWQFIKKHYGAQTVGQTAQMYKQNAPLKPPSTPGLGGTPQPFQMDFRKLVTGGGSEAPVVKMVDQMIMQAIEDRASDIHIEPEEDFIRVRFRIDGVLVEGEKLPKDVQSPIVSRIKIMAKLDIAERRKPQDGKLTMAIGGKQVDIRVSCYPTTYGENVVLRVLDRSATVLDLKEMGFSKPLHESFNKLLNAPFGIILVTGPTGAGKTTTLYAALQQINTVDKNIMTIEDPIEYQIPMIRQSQVNVKAGLTFATGLRSLLRQDPDVMLIGEIRDKETAEIAVESALTGHLVFATLHTNDSAGAITRLQDMGVETFLISSALIGSMAQRLVRRICQECRVLTNPSEMHLTPEVMKWLEHIRTVYQDELGGPEAPIQLYVPKGCEKCKNIGFKGRLAIYELMSVDDSIRASMTKRDASSEVRAHAFQKANLSMRQYGFLKALQGLTTIAEVLKVVQSD